MWRTSTRKKARHSAWPALSVRVQPLRGSDAPMPPATDTGDDDSIGGPGTPVSLTFLGGHYQDAKLCAFTRTYQQATGFEKLHPKLWQISIAVRTARFCLRMLS